MLIDFLKSVFPSIIDAIGGLLTGRTKKSITLKANNNIDSTIYQVAGNMHINAISKEELKDILRELLKENAFDDNKHGEATFSNIDTLLDVLNSGESFTIYELERKLMVSRKTVNKYIQELLKAGKIVSTGTSRKDERFKLNTSVNKEYSHD